MAGYRGPSEPLRYQLVEQRILALIESGTIVPGSKVPSLREMAVGTGVSLSSTSQAYAILEQRGILEARPRSGYFVRRAPTSLLSTEAPQPQTQEVREVRRGELIRRAMNFMGRDDILPLGLAQVDPELLPGKDMARILSAVVRRLPERCANYGSVSGAPELRRQIARRLALAGVSATPDELITTCGATEGLSMALRVMTRPGDTVLVATPTYHFFLQMIEVLGLRVIEIPSHPIHGISIPDLASALDRFPIAACVLSPTWNNPDGSLLNAEDKRALVEILHTRDVPLIEDDIYGDITFSGPRPPACKAFDQHGIVTLVSSFSKALAPGYRTGFLLPGQGLEKNILELKAMTTFAAVTSVEIAVAEYLEKGLYERHLLRLNRALRDQVAAMRDAVATYFPQGTKATNPGGGFMLWVELPEQGVNGTNLYHLAAAEGIGISPGMLFGMSDRFERYIRLNCGLVMSERVVHAIKRLGQLARG